MHCVPGGIRIKNLILHRQISQVSTVRNERHFHLCQLLSSLTHIYAVLMCGKTRAELFKCLFLLKMQLFYCCLRLKMSKYRIHLDSRTSLLLPGDENFNSWKHHHYYDMNVRNRQRFVFLFFFVVIPHL